MKLLKFLDEKAEEWLLIGALMFIVTLVSFQVVARYVFNYSLSWSEELSRYILVWIAWIGASYAVKKREHLRVDLIKNFLSSTNKKILELLVIIIWFFLPLVFATVGTKMVMMIESSEQTGQTINTPMWIIYLIIPIGGVLMCIRLIQQFIYITKSFKSIE